MQTLMFGMRKQQIVLTQSSAVQKKAAMHTLVRLLAVCSLEQVRTGVSGLDIHQFSKALFACDKSKLLH